MSSIPAIITAIYLEIVLVRESLRELGLRDLYSRWYGREHLWKTIPHHYIRRISWWGRRSGRRRLSPRLELTDDDIQIELDRRRPGQSRLVTQRQEADRVEIFSGVFEGRTIGSPIGMLVRNEDARSGAYDDMRTTYRPSHADWTTEAKYGIRNWQGGGRASARKQSAVSQEAPLLGS